MSPTPKIQVKSDAQFSAAQDAAETTITFMPDTMLHGDINYLSSLLINIVRSWSRGIFNIGVLIAQVAME
jgi:hypothetical protein